MLLKNRLSKNNKGMSLVEVIALIAVLSVVVAAVVGFMITGSKMSVKVSGTAGASIKEQTAVEFINKTILKYDASALELHGEDEEPKALKIKFSVPEGTYARICTENDTVVYKIVGSDGSSKVTELCPGTIEFISLENNTVIYKLNGEKHVLYLRVTPGE